MLGFALQSFQEGGLGRVGLAVQGVGEAEVVVDFGGVGRELSCVLKFDQRLRELAEP